MDLFQRVKSVGHSEGELIEWNTPPMVKYNTCNINYMYNNPFDDIELKASNMDPFDLVLNETETRKELSCTKILSPLWEIKFRPFRKSMSLTDIRGLSKMLEEEDQSGGVIDQSKENCAPMIENRNIEDKKKQTIEETRRRQRIDMLLEKTRKKYKEEWSPKPLFCMPHCNCNSSLNKTSSSFSSSLNKLQVSPVSKRFTISIKGKEHVKPQCT